MVSIDRPVGLCPCESGLGYAFCCGPLHAGTKEAPTAESLMRSRYSAFALGLSDYLVASWHPDTRPVGVRAHEPERWTGLTIVATARGGRSDDDGEVEFIAHHVDGDLRQRSNFVRLDGRWVFV